MRKTRRRPSALNTIAGPASATCCPIHGHNNDTRPLRTTDPLHSALACFFRGRVAQTVRRTAIPLAAVFESMLRYKSSQRFPRQRRLTWQFSLTGRSRAFFYRSTAGSPERRRVGILGETRRCSQSLLLPTGRVRLCRVPVPEFPGATHPQTLLAPPPYLAHA